MGSSRKGRSLNERRGPGIQRHPRRDTLATRSKFVGKRIAIIGGGASGALVAIALLSRLSQGDEVTIFDPSSQIGRGVAYGTVDGSHLLNVRAGSMSAFPQDAGHFARWAIEKKIAEDPTEFVSRREFGTYLAETLEAVRSESAAELQILRENATRICPALTVTTQAGSTTPFDAIILATGNRPPVCPQALNKIKDHPRYIGSPWTPGAFEGIDYDDKVFILGTGLTMVDAYLTLANRGHRGQVIARSRHGFLPKSHQLGPPLPTTLEDVSGEDLLRSLTQRVKTENWRAAVDGLRPHSDSLWKALSLDQKKRFLTKLRPYWDVHRHRIPEAVAKTLEEAQAVGRLNVGSGRVSQVEEGFQIHLGNSHLHADWIINCTGPKSDIRSERIPILESAVESGLANYDPLGMGLVVDDDGRTETEGKVWAIGPLCRGSRWETTAIPEIRNQAAKIAELLGH